MPRPHRLDFPSALQYVRVRGRDGASIFFDGTVLARFPKDAHGNAPHVQRFESLLNETCAECGSLLHGYCVLPNVGTLLLQTKGAALGAVMQRLCGQYSRYWRIHYASAAGSSPFRGRYESKVLAPEYLPHALRRTHQSPMLAGLCQRAVDYPFSSARIYNGRPSRVVLDPAAVTAALERRGLGGIRGYREFMDQLETPFVGNLLECGSALDSRIVGSKLFLAQVRQWATHPPPPPAREHLIAWVARLIRKEPKELYLATHTAVLGRSLVAWYGVRAGTASLKDIGAWFSVSGATLGQGIRHYRQVAPELFNQQGLLGPAFEPGTDFARNRHSKL